MKKILVTGASGFVGNATASALSMNSEVVCLSRRDPGLDLPWVRGDFSDFEDLRKLDKHEITGVVHLAAVTGGCSERDAMLINVEGTRRLMRYLIDRGVRKFVMASSIAATGIQHTSFRPLQVPIPDDHPCFDRDGYGLSKYLMEEVTKYYQRQNDQLDVINLRLGVVRADDDPPVPFRTKPMPQWGFGHVSCIALSDIVRAITLALTSPPKPGVRILNVVGPRACSYDPVATLLRAWYPNGDLDLSHYEKPGDERAPLFDMDGIRRELGFVPQHDVLHLPAEDGTLI